MIRVTPIAGTALALLTWLCWAPAAGRADAALGSTRPVHVAADGCDADFVQRLDALLRIELGPRAAPVSVAASARRERAPDAIAVELACAHEQLVAVASAGGDRVRREPIALAQTPPALRPRVAALRVAELVRALDRALARAEPDAGPERARNLVIGPVRAPRSDPREPGPTRPPPLELALLGQAGSFHGDGAWLWGAALAFDYALPPLALGASVAVAQRAVSSALGDAAILAAQLAPHVAASWTAGRWQLRAGLGCAFGLVRVSAEARSERAVARNLTAPWLAPHALAVLGHALTPALRLQLRAALGAVALPVVAEVEQAPDIALRGLWLQLQVGLALGW